MEDQIYFYYAEYQLNGIENGGFGIYRLEQGNSFDIIEFTEDVIRQIAESKKVEIENIKNFRIITLNRL